MFKVIPRSQIIDFPSQNIDLVQKVYILWLSKRSFNTYLRKQIFRSTNESCSLVRETLGTRLHHNKAKVLNSRDSFTCSNNEVRVMYSDVSYPWACSQDHLIRFKEVFLCEPLQHDKIYCADDSYKGVPGKTIQYSMQISYSYWICQRLYQPSSTRERHWSPGSQKLVSKEFLRNASF